jgi:hypothetical protein
MVRKLYVKGKKKPVMRMRLHLSVTISDVIHVEEALSGLDKRASVVCH